MTKKTGRSYKILCNKLDTLLNVKVFTEKEEIDLYKKLIDTLSGAEGFSPIEYKKFIVRSFLVDHEIFINSLPGDFKEDEDSINEAFETAYESIITAFPVFSLEHICADVNTEVFIGAMGRQIIEKIRKKDEHPIVKNNEEKKKALGLSEDFFDVSSIEQKLFSEIIGQKEAITEVINNLKLLYSGIVQKFSLLFVGPTGVGKTKLAKLLGQYYSGNFLKINCAEQSAGHEFARFIGSPPGYLGHKEKSFFAEKAEISNKWVFLFDEIEKAHPKFYDFLLSLLDDGTCTDNNGAELDFSESIFLFTSNKGVENLKLSNIGFSKGNKITQNQVQHTLKTSIESHFSPEFINRLDDIVIFNHLSEEEAKQIIKIELEKFPIKISDDLVSFILKKGYSQVYGARNLQRSIRKIIGLPLSDVIIKNKLPKEGYLFDVNINNELVTFE